MSWSNIKKAINSTMGTDNFKPLNEIVENSFQIVVNRQNASHKELSQRISNNEEKVSTFDGRISNNTKRIVNLESGIPLGLFQSDSTVAYIKNVPSDARPYAQMEKIGGLSTQPINRLNPSYIEEATYPPPNQDLTPAVNVTLLDDGRFRIVSTAQHQGETVIILVIQNLNKFLQAGKKYHIKSSSSDEIEPLVFKCDKETGENQSMFFDTFTLSPESDEIVQGFGFRVTGVVGQTIEVMIYADGEEEPSDFVPYVSDDISHAKVTKVISDNYELEIPEEIQNFDGYGIGISSSVHNYVEILQSDGVDDKIIRFIKMCELREYSEGDLNIEGALTDGHTQTIIPLSEPIVQEISNTSDFDGFIKVVGGGTVEFLNENSQRVPSTIIYQLKEV